jgi:hypothetical protein
MMKNTMRRFVAWVLMPALLMNSLFVPIARAYDASFDVDSLLDSGVKGMFDDSCGGYCIVGACAHLVVKVSWKGIEVYTVISPKIKHAAADLVISAYDHVGEEPWEEWRSAVGESMDVVNTGPVAPILGTPFGLQGGRPQRARQDEHQSVNYKEVDIIGHPASIIPQVATINGDIDTNKIVSGYETPSIGSLPNPSEAVAVDKTNAKDNNPDNDYNLSAMMDSGLTSILGVITDRIDILLEAFDIIEYIQHIIDAFDVFTDLLEFYNNAMLILETTTRSTIYANLANPKFRADRIFCPSEIKPFQPYYLTFADSFFWRTGFPITDGPISGSNHSMTILNPLSGDALGSDVETWGRLYPRDGTINTNHDSKAASVAAWRALDVLLNDVRDGDGGHRVGVSLPDGYWHEDGRWQMIYPVERACSATPYYEDDGPDLDFMKPNEHGGYAWNYYHIYECCTNTRGKKLLEAPLLIPICLDLPL